MKNEILIVSITKKKKNYVIETNEDEYLIDEDTIIKYNIYKDARFSKDEFNKIINEANVNNYFLKTLNYLSYSSRTVKEIENYLTRYQVKEIDQQTIIKKLTDFGYLDDYKFAVGFIEYESVVKQRGPKYIKLKLHSKGVSEEIINDLLLSYKEELQINNIRDISEKEMKVKNNLPPKKQKQLITDKLLRLGYDNSLVYEYVGNLEIKDNSLDSLQKDFQKIYDKYKNKDISSAEKKNKIITFLLNKGYEYTNILEIFTNLEY